MGWARAPAKSAQTTNQHDRVTTPTKNSRDREPTLPNGGTIDSTKEHQRCPDQRSCDFADPQADPRPTLGATALFHPMLVKPQTGGSAAICGQPRTCPQIAHNRTHPERLVRPSSPGPAGRS